MSGMKPLVDLLRERQRPDKKPYLDLIEVWLSYWMNQTQNSEADRANYFRRAFGVDANMRHHLAKLLAEKTRTADVDAAVIECVKALDEYARSEKLLSEAEFKPNIAANALANLRAVLEGGAK
jgi:hypothetical protein